MTQHEQQTDVIVFTWQGALLGVAAYFVVALIVAAVFV